MKNENPIRVLSLSTYMLGLVTFQDTLEQIFPQYISEVEFISYHLPKYFKSDLLGRILYGLLSKRIIFHQSDWDFHRFRIELAVSFFARRCLERQIKIHQPQVLHICTQGIALLSAPIFHRVPTVVQIDYTAALLAKEHPEPASITYQPIVAFEKKCFQAATHVITCSERARQSVISDYGIKPEKVSHLDYPVRLELFSGRNDYSIEQDLKTRLLFIGNDFIRKGGEDLVTVFLEHFSETCELDLVTNAEVDLPKMPNLRLHRGIRPLSPELLSLFQSADIFVMPTHEDVYGIVYQEAMAAGLPCIGTTVMAVPELVQHGVNGLTIPPRDRAALRQAIHQLVEQPELRLKMGMKGKEMAKQRFDPVQKCRKLANIFADCAKAMEEPKHS